MTTYQTPPPSVDVLADRRAVLMKASVAPGPYLHGYGITIHQLAAIEAMKGFCANPSIFAPNGLRGWSLVNCTEEQIGEYAVEMANALIIAIANCKPEGGL